MYRAEFVTASKLILRTDERGVLVDAVIIRAIVECDTNLDPIHGPLNFQYVPLISAASSLQNGRQFIVLRMLDQGVHFGPALFETISDFVSPPLISCHNITAASSTNARIVLHSPHCMPSGTSGSGMFVVVEGTVHLVGIASYTDIHDTYGVYRPPLDVEGFLL